MGDTLVACITLGAGEMGNAGVMVEIQGLLPGMEVTTRAGVTESVLSDHLEPSCLEGGQDPGVTDSDLLGVVCPGAGTKVSSMVHDRRSCISAVMLVTSLQGYFSIGCVDEGSGEET